MRIFLRDFLNYLSGRRKFTEKSITFSELLNILYNLDTETFRGRFVRDVVFREGYFTKNAKIKNVKNARNYLRLAYFPRDSEDRMEITYTIYKGRRKEKHYIDLGGRGREAHMCFLNQVK